MDIFIATLLLCSLLHKVGGQSPVLSVEPRGTAVRVGDSASFRCRVVSGSQPVQLEWKRTGTQLLGDNVKIGPDGSVLTISNARLSNQGPYRCLATNSQGRSTITASLTIKQAPKVRVTPGGPVRVRVGNPVNLECQSTGKPRPSVTWHRQADAHETTLATTAMEDGKTVMSVAAARPEDSGVYLCRAVNSEGSAEVKLEVAVEGGAQAGVAPRASVTQTELAAVEGQTVTLQCQASGSPTPIISWSKLRAPLPWQHKVSEGTLTLTNLGRQDSGQYICNATNAVGYSQAYVQLEVDSPPYTTCLPDLVRLRPGDALRVQCLAHGSHPIRFQWTRVGGARLPERVETTREGLLLIGQVNASDGGTYKCTATNHVGSSEALAKVVVRA